MKLKKGITIYNELPAGSGAVSINSGTVFHTKQPAEMVSFNGYHYRPGYEDNAYVPKRDWRSCTPAEARLLQANGNRKDHNTVYVGELPAAIQNSFRQLEITGSKSRAEVMEKLRQHPERIKKLNGELTIFLTPMAGDKPFHFHCVGTNMPNVEMVACNTSKLPQGYEPPDMKSIGMHNDGTLEMTLYTAHKFGNRISINAGEQARSFLFVNLSLVQAVNMLKKKTGVGRINITNIPAYFFKHFPGYPVVQVRLEPYQYYIAATNNFFHDGSTLGSSALDISFVYFGSFTC